MCSVPIGRQPVGLVGRLIADWLGISGRASWLDGNLVPNAFFWNPPFGIPETETPSLSLSLTHSNLRPPSGFSAAP